MSATDIDGEVVDTLAAICNEAIEIFRYDKELRPQDRAHRYLEDHKVTRGYNDTALQVCVLDLVNRAYQVGAREVFEEDLGLEQRAAALTQVSAELLQAALHLRGLAPLQPCPGVRCDTQAVTSQEQ